MAATYHTGSPKWIAEEAEMKRNTNDGAAHYTNDTPTVNYQSRSDNPQAKLPT
jgi:hypothetical protein